MSIKWKTSGAVFGASLATCAAIPGFAADDVTLKFSSFVGERNPIFACSMMPLVDELEANQSTKVMVERYFGGGGFGKPTVQYDQAMRGITDISFGMFTYTEGLFPLTDIIAMPFVMNKHEAATKVLNEVILPQYLQQEMQDVKIINMWLTSPYQFHMVKHVDDLADMKGARVRTVGKVQVDAVTALGAQVVSFPAPATYESLQKSVIDGTTATWTTATAFKVGEVAKIHYEVNFGGAVGFTVMNLDSYEALPDDVKAIIDRHSGPAASMKVAGCFSETDKKAKAKWIAAGNEVIVVSDEMRENMKAKVLPITDAYLQTLEARGLPAMAVRDRILSELAKLN